MKPLITLLLIFGILLLLPTLDKPEPQTVVPECFEKADCLRLITEGFCNVRFDCIQGKCYSDDVLCPETCNSGKDDDMDGLIDCDDDDCWDNPLCHCSIMDFNECAFGRCYCPGDSRPRWHIEATNFCRCI